MIEMFEMTPEGVQWVPLSEVSESDRMDLELALMTDEPKLLCYKCFKPIPNGTGNACDAHTPKTL